MSATQKDWISKWLPLIFAVGANIVTVAYGYGKLEQRLDPIERYVQTYTHERAVQSFVTRTEFTQQITTRDREMNELRAQYRDIIARLDRMIERENNR
jgi:hypothetical protein